MILICPGCDIDFDKGSERGGCAVCSCELTIHILINHAHGWYGWQGAGREEDLCCTILMILFIFLVVHTSIHALCLFRYFINVLFVAQYLLSRHHPFTHLFRSTRPSHKLRRSTPLGPRRPSGGSRPGTGSPCRMWSMMMTVVM